MNPIEYEFEKRKIKVVAKVLFECAVDIEIAADSFSDGTLVENLRKVCDAAVIDEAHRQVQAGLSQVRVFGMGAHLIPAFKGQRVEKTTIDETIPK